MATNPSLSDWSELVSDVLLLVYECLSFAEFARVRTVCSSWYSVLRSPRKNHVPWLILKQDGDWKLFDPEEGKFYKTHISSCIGLANFRCLESCGRWVLVIDEEANLNIFNPFTSEIINLPPLEYGARQILWAGVRKAVLWVDEITKDYLVVCKSNSFDNLLYFCMKRDEKLIQTPKYEYLGEGWCVDMAYNYKDNKLYILSDNGNMTVLDFSQDFPRKVPNHPYVNRPFNTNRRYSCTRIKLTTSGDVFLMARDQYPSKFEVYKMNNTSENWEIVDSLEEEEAVFWGLSVTLPTKGVSGIKKDTICFCEYGYDSDSKSSFLRANTYDISTHRIERFVDLDLHKFSDFRWLLPCLGKSLADRD